MPPNPPLYSVPPQPSSPYLGPSPFPLSDLQSYAAAGAPRHALPRSAMLPALSASPPASFQISPPLHQQLSLHQGSLLNQPIRMQQVQSQPIISHQMGLQASLHSPGPGQQVWWEKSFTAAHSVTSERHLALAKKRSEIQLSSGVRLQHAVMRCDVFDSGQRRARLLCCFVR